MTELSAIERGKKALREMQAEGVRITKNAVATRAKFDHTNFNKKDYEWPDFRDDVENAQKEQRLSKEAKEVEALREDIIALKDQLKKAKSKVKELESGVQQKQFKEIVAKMGELYRMNDKLNKENHELKDQLQVGGGVNTDVVRVDTETGEVIEGIFDKKL